ncbi:MAG: hypothetical protein ACREIH_03250, partial [Nitrospiraceae bacterium]
IACSALSWRFSALSLALSAHRPMFSASRASSRRAAATIGDTRPGPKGARQTLTLRERVLDLRAQDRSVKEIADALSAEGIPISHQSVWVIVSSEGLSRLPPRARKGHGPPPRTEPVWAAPLDGWPSLMP